MKLGLLTFHKFILIILESRTFRACFWLKNEEQKSEQKQIKTKNLTNWIDFVITVIMKHKVKHNVTSTNTITTAAASYQNAQSRPEISFARVAWDYHQLISLLFATLPGSIHSNIDTTQNDNNPQVSGGFRCSALQTRLNLQTLSRASHRLTKTRLAHTIYNIWALNIIRRYPTTIGCFEHTRV